MMSDEEFENELGRFGTWLSSQQEPLGKEFEEVLQDNLWDLMTHDNSAENRSVNSEFAS